MQNIQNLQRICKTLSGGNYNGVQGQYAFGFDGINDYIAGDTIIGRTGYDMNISGNVSTSSDSDGSYFYFDGNRNATAATGTMANIGPSATPAFTQATDFTFSCKFNVAALPVSDYSGIFGSLDDFAMCLYNTNHIRIVSKPTYSALTVAYTLGTTVTIHVVYQASSGKAFVYKDGVLQNAGGTAMSPTFTTNAWNIGDNGSETGTNTSTQKKIYHAAIRNVALTKAEIDADIALGNTAKSDSRIVAYYIPENLQYNTDYITTKDFTNASWTKTGTVVTGGQADLRGGTSAALLTISAGAGNGVTLINNTITGSTIASKTFKMKMFAWTTAGSATVRLKIVHNGVATYYSSDLTVTTTPQEFTFTQTLTSSTSGTGMTYGIEVGSGAGAATFIAYYPTGWLTNQTLRDMSTSMLGYVGPLNQKVLSCWFKPTADAADTAIAQMLINAPYLYIHIRASTNAIRVRRDDSFSSKESTYTLGNGFRSRCHVVGVYYRTGTAFATKLYINGVLVDGPDVSNFAYSANGTNTTVTQLNVGARSTTYYSGYIRDPRLYTFTGSFTDADAETIYKGGDPAGLTKYLNWRPMVGESGNTVLDYSGNSRNGTLTGGAYRTFVPN